MDIDVKDCMYVRVNFRGYIGVLDIHGPVPHNYIAKSTIINLIKEGYDVEILNPSDDKAFAEEVEKLVKQIKSGEKVDKDTKVIGLTGDKDDGTGLGNENDPVKNAIKKLDGKENINGNPKITGQDAVSNAMNNLEKKSHDLLEDDKEMRDQLNGLNNIK